MKIERISENQIRCTLNNFDLSARNLIGQQLHSLERGVYSLAAKGIKTCYQYFHLFSTLLCQ